MRVWPDVDQVIDRDARGIPLQRLTRPDRAGRPRAGRGPRIVERRQGARVRRDHDDAVDSLRDRCRAASTTDASSPASAYAAVTQRPAARAAASSARMPTAGPYMLASDARMPIVRVRLVPSARAALFTR